MNRRHFIKSAAGAVTLTAMPVQPSRAASADKNAKPYSAKMAPRFHDGRDWWFEKRFGMFVHWGLYSIEGFHEQQQWRKRVPREEYVKLAQRWNPVKFNPNAWLDLAEKTGMQYLCLTTKHHDGFCLWDTKMTAYNTMNTPYGKDLIRQLAEACHRRKFPLCLYYSIADWHQPNYPNQGRHHELPPQPQDQPDLMKYLEFLRAQIRELCKNYGEIHGFWWDMNVDKHVDPSINDLIRKLQPKAVINNRGYDEGDFGTPERDYEKDADVPLSFEKRTEACQSIGTESWGFRVEEDYYCDRHLLRSIAKYLARDANYLLNIGPKADGTIPDEAVNILGRVGQWYHAVKESLMGVSPASHLTANRNLLLTRKNNNLYVLLYKDPVADTVKLKPFDLLPRKATLLNDGRNLPCSLEMVPSDHVEQKGYLRIRQLPVNEMANTVMVVKLEFDHLPETLSPTGTGDKDEMKRR